MSKTYSHAEVKRRQRIAKIVALPAGAVLVGLVVWGSVAGANSSQYVPPTTTTTVGMSRCVYDGTCDAPTGNDAPDGDSHGWDY